LGRLGGVEYFEIFLFSMCSQQVPNTFLKFPQVHNVLPNMFTTATHFVPYHLGMIQCGWVNIEIYINFYVSNEYFYIGKSPKFQVVFFVVSQSKKPITKKEKKEVELWAPYN
jgi:hypothetical protein